MGRSLKKVPNLDEKLLKKIKKLKDAGRKEPIKTWSRRSIIPRILLVGPLMSIMEKRLFLFTSQRIWLVINWVSFLPREFFVIMAAIRKNR